MKNTLIFVLLLVFGYFLFKKYRQQNDPLAAHLAEQDALQQIGNVKQAVNALAQIPIQQLGELPLSGVNTSVFNLPITAGAKDSTLLPKLFPNPYDETIAGDDLL